MPPSATRSLVWSCSSVVFISFGQTGPKLCFAHGQCSHAVFLFALPWQWPWPSSRSSESSEMALHPVPNCRRFVTEWPGVGNNEHRKKRVHWRGDPPKDGQTWLRHLIFYCIEALVDFECRERGVDNVFEPWEAPLHDAWIESILFPVKPNLWCLLPC